MLHDIGKLAVPEHIVTKPGLLSEAEFERIKIHPVAGAEILDQVQFPYPVAPVVRAHHEKWDGTGYPEGLSGTAIPIGARILAAVDCFDALVSDRYHRKAMSLDQAMDYLRSESGKSFDPEVVAIRCVEARARRDQHVLLLEPLDGGRRTWECLVRPARKVRAGETLFSDGVPVARVDGRTPSGDTMSVSLLVDEPLELLEQANNLLRK